MRHLIAALILAALVLPAPVAGAAGAPGGCAPAFALRAVSELGSLFGADALAEFTGTDRNQDEMICIKSAAQLNNRPSGEVRLTFTDNTNQSGATAAPGRVQQARALCRDTVARQTAAEISASGGIKAGSLGPANCDQFYLVPQL
jgi:hypothetical protein